MNEVRSTISRDTQVSYEINEDEEGRYVDLIAKGARLSFSPQAFDSLARNAKSIIEDEFPEMRQETRTVTAFCRECQAPTPHSLNDGCLVCAREDGDDEEV